MDYRLRKAKRDFLAQPTFSKLVGLERLQNQCNNLISFNLKELEHKIDFLAKKHGFIYINHDFISDSYAYRKNGYTFVNDFNVQLNFDIRNQKFLIIALFFPLGVTSYSRATIEYSYTKKEGYIFISEISAGKSEKSVKPFMEEIFKTTFIENLFPLYFNYFYCRCKSEYNDQKQKLNVLEKQLTELKVVTLNNE